MFKDKEVRGKVSDVIKELNKKASYDELNRRFDQYVECAKCGCLVRKTKAVKVQTMVDKDNDKDSTTEYLPDYFWYENVLKKYVSGQIEEPEKKIKTEYFCITHAPKAKK